MIFVARCPECRCPVTVLEISDSLSRTEMKRRHQLVEKWKGTGAIIEAVPEPPLPELLQVHAPECGRLKGYGPRTAEAE